MASRKSSRKASKAPKAEPEIIELSSDSEPEVIEPKAVQVEEQAKEPEDEEEDEVYDQPLLRAAGIRYKSDKLEEERKKQQEQQETTPNPKLAVRSKETGSVKHKHVSIEIPLPSSTSKSKTPMERRHITFDDSDHEEFVTPSEVPKKNPLETAVPNRVEEVQDSAEEDEEDSDDEAPEAVSTRVAEAETKAKASKAAQAAAKAAEKEAAALKRKRQERDAIFKQQAKERKQAEEEAKALKGEDAEESALEAALESPEKRKREVPELLPLELLESDDEDKMDMDTEEPAGLNKRRKLDGTQQRLLREPRAARDRQVGSTVYRVVAKASDGKQAPKAKKQSVNLKTELLRRDKKPQPRTGFFVKKR
ncbi:hypothetical protein QBC38DRAFT_380135 [Podospora fimiseda]|uniref:Uncharacterized protein n=1 Tax=Podospora fimiseda TaxID=252190 RepID=A0AAN7BYN0_9PEZI|nr:hypothetical protein QBC38DRAFT_380135 [Podospora fimiseda]